MEHKTRPASVPTRLPFPEWKALVRQWMSVKAGETDRRHGGDLALWDEEVRRSMPISVRDPALPLFAVETQDKDVLEIVYSGVTPSGHMSYLNEHNITPCMMTFETMLGFSQRFNTKFKFSETAVLLRRVLASDSKALFDRVPQYDERDLFYALRMSPSVLELTQEKMAPLMAELVQGWVKFYQNASLSVFLDCAKAGHVKTLNAMIAAGFNPYDHVNMSGNTAGASHLQGLLNHAEPTVDHPYPASFRKTLALLDPREASSNHAQLSRSELFQDGAVARILAADPKARIAGISLADWQEHSIKSETTQ
jgi:hypothetical protein